MSKLVIVESPAKAHTIQKYLGSAYTVMASNGHVRDLPVSRLGVDVDGDFRPRYETIRGKGELLKRLRAAARKSEFVYLATDPDREGEAISWHLAALLKLSLEEKNRVTFTEITRSGIASGMAHPRSVDLRLVGAQQARRVLDRIVGYKISPFLWKKIRKGLSAGRVQSVAVRLVVDREEEIRAFQPEEYWTIEALLHRRDGEEQTFLAKYHGCGEKKIVPKTEEEALGVVEAIRGKPLEVTDLRKGIRRKTPPPPFITSTLQQEASRRFGFQSRRTMKIAQELYEGVRLEDLGAVGLITYMRTDSLRVSKEALEAAKNHIQAAFGERYALEKPRIYRSSANAQDGHEAIRPTMTDLTPEKVRDSLTDDQYRLYRLIWERFLGSQMAAEVQNVVSADLQAEGHLLKASGHSVVFDGYTRLYAEPAEKTSENVLPDLKKGETVLQKELTPSRHFTQPPPRFTEATLIRELEENGIGRPSTYAPTLSTIQQRGYVKREQKSLVPTDVGEITTRLMKEQFRDIVDVTFTAGMERRLDEIEAGKLDWTSMMASFYRDFSANIERAEKNMDGVSMRIPDEETDIPCELCGRMMVIRQGKYGKFLACPGFPECKNTRPLVREADGNCPVCGKRMLLRKSRTGRTYYGCSGFPDCRFMTWDVPLSRNCPKCGSTLFQSTGRSRVIRCLKEGCGFETDGKRP